jgi:hypothetical protein
MRSLFEEMLWRPLEAVRSSAELLRGTARGEQLIDGMLSRLVHGLSRPFGADGGGGETRRRPCCPGGRGGARPRRGRGRERGSFE